MILVEVDIPEKLTIANIYIPPQLSCAPTLASSLLPILLRDSIVGDVNGHNDLWSAGANDVHGDSFVDEIDSSFYHPQQPQPVHSSVFIIFTRYCHRPAESCCPGASSLRLIRIICLSPFASTTTRLRNVYLIALSTFRRRTGLPSNLRPKHVLRIFLFPLLALRAKRFGEKLSRKSRRRRFWQDAASTSPRSLTLKLVVL